MSVRGYTYNQTPNDRLLAWCGLVTPSSETKFPIGDCFWVIEGLIEEKNYDININVLLTLLTA